MRDGEWDHTQIGQFYVEAVCTPGYVAQRQHEEQRLRDQMIQELLDKARAFGFPQQERHA